MALGRKPPKNSRQAGPAVPAKKPYAAPSLVEYGSVAKLTANGGLSGTDGRMMMASCL